MKKTIVALALGALLLAGCSGNVNSGDSCTKAIKSADEKLDLYHDAVQALIYGFETKDFSTAEARIDRATEKMYLNDYELHREACLNGL